MQVFAYRVNHRQDLLTNLFKEANKRPPLKGKCSCSCKVARRLFQPMGGDRVQDIASSKGRFIFFVQKTITRAGNPLNKYTYVENWPSREKLEE